MDKLLFVVCAVVLAAMPVQGAGNSTGPKKEAEAAVKSPRAGPAPRRERDSASTGSSAPERRHGTDLGYEAEKEEEAFLKKKRTAPLNAR